MRLFFIFASFIIGSSLGSSLLAQNETSNTETIAIDSALVEITQFAKGMINETIPEKRKENCFKFIPALVNYLKQDNSFEKDLSAIKEISVLYAPDNSFRILTWAVEETISNTGAYKTYTSVDELLANPLNYVYYGAIQMNSPELQLFPLEDKSAEMRNPEDLILDHKNWFGSIYYNITEFNLNGQKCFALFGWDGNTGISGIKIMDILSFINGKPSFGMPIIEVVRDDQKFVKNRFIHEFRAGSGVSLNWDEQRAMVIYDFIEPPEPESKGIYPTYIPDGTYNGLKYEDGLWRYVKRVYEGNSISPDQLLQDRANANQAKEKKKKKSKKRKK